MVVSIISLLHTIYRMLNMDVEVKCHRSKVDTSCSA